MNQQSQPPESDDEQSAESVGGTEQPVESDQPGSDQPGSGQDAEQAQSEEVQAGEPASLEQQLQAALADAAEQKDAALRAVAELENVRRRSQRDVQNAHKFGSEKLLRDLLQVADSLELALANSDDEQAEVEGVRMTFDLLITVLEKNDVTRVDPQGEAFNPDLHQAMTMQPSDEVEPNHVLQVVQKGYQLHDRLLRPAMVVVSKATE